MPLPALPARLAAAALALACLSGCGDDEVTPKSETLSACDEVWVAGEALPKDYEGCVGEDDVLEVSEIKKCTSNDGSFVTFDDTFFAILGQQISDAGPNSAEYDELYRSCFSGGW